MTEIDVKGLRELLAEIDGVPVFAWWPVSLRDGSGFFWTGRFAWLRKTWKARRIGHPSYFYTDDPIGQQLVPVTDGEG